MRKRKPQFNVSAAIRDYLAKHPDATGRQCRESIERSEGVPLNPASFGVAMSNQRKRLGLAAKGPGGRVVATKPKPSSDGLEQLVNNLTAAKQFVEAVGGHERAAEALKQLAMVQIN